MYIHSCIFRRKRLPLLLKQSPRNRRKQTRCKVCQSRLSSTTGWHGSSGKQREEADRRAPIVIIVTNGDALLHMTAAPLEEQFKAHGQWEELTPMKVHMKLKKDKIEKPIKAVEGYEKRHIVRSNT